jgi:hypothetical protein
MSEDARVDDLRMVKRALSTWLRSACNSASSHSRSSASSQAAWAGRSVIRHRTTKASRTAGTASMMNTHCQPLSPSVPSISRMAPERIDATAFETGTARNRMDKARAR